LVATFVVPAFFGAYTDADGIQGQEVFSGDVLVERIDRRN
jgi:hypothetical protein